MAKRCIFAGCSGWQAVGSLLCRKCAANPAAVRAAEIHSNLDTFLAMPAQYRLMCYTVTGDPAHVALAEGEAVDILELDPSGMCLCRTEGGKVGLYPRAHLLTEDEIYERFIAEEDARLQAELDEQKRAKDAAEEQYEQQLRQRMKQKAEDDKRQRALDAERRAAEAARLQEELEFRRKWEAEQAAAATEAERQAKAEVARRQREAAAKREAEAREQKKKWDEQEEAMRIAREEASMPAWKRDLVAKRRASAGESTSVFPGAAPR